MGSKWVVAYPHRCLRSVAAPERITHVTDVSWADAVTAIGGVLTPVAVVVLGVVFSRRQLRSDELLSARIDYYKELAPDLNTLMCYMTLVGT
jgi:hypothetical protein